MEAMQTSKAKKKGLCQDMPQETEYAKIDFEKLAPKTDHV
jgi:hypothetical protein